MYKIITIIIIIWNLQFILILNVQFFLRKNMCDNSLVNPAYHVLGISP